MKASAPSGHLVSLVVKASAPSGHLVSLVVKASAPSGHLVSLVVKASTPSGHFVSLVVKASAQSGRLISLVVKASAPSGHLISLVVKTSAQSGHLVSLVVKASAQSGRLISLVVKASTPSGHFVSLVVKASVPSGHLASLVVKASPSVQEQQTRVSSSSSSSVFPAVSVASNNLGNIFAYVIIFNPTTETATFCLLGWCMLGVVLLPAFIRLGHERQGLLSLCDGMHVCTSQILIYSLIRKSYFREWSHHHHHGGPSVSRMILSVPLIYGYRSDSAGRWSQNPCQLQGKNPLYQKISPLRMIEPTRLHQAGQRAQHTTNKLNKLFWPLDLGLISSFCHGPFSQVNRQVMPVM